VMSRLSRARKALRGGLTQQFAQRATEMVTYGL
jgi:DNA-directed RNA polymerase specialized sigma24 family protein